MNGQRGQVLPLWIGGILGSLALMFFALNYAYVFSWQVKAQNAADSAAQAVVSIQTQEWNEMNEMLYASAVEEYRIRFLINGMIIASHGSGGCWNGPGTGDSGSNCSATYATMQQEYMQAVNRYTTDVVTFNEIAANTNIGNQTSDAAQLLKTLPGTAQYDLDSDFSYTILNLAERTNGLTTVTADGLYISQSHFSYSSGSLPGGFNATLFGPMQVEIGVCDQNVQPLTAIAGSFFGFTTKSFTVTGRAAATAVMVEQDWLQPGSIVDPNTGTWFQPTEDYQSTASVDTSDNYNWYQVDYGGIGNTANSTTHSYSFSINQDEFSERVGWWNSVPYPPYTGAQSQSALCASS